MRAATIVATTRSSMLSRITSLFSAQNLIFLVGLLTLGGSAVKYVKDWIISWLMTKYLISKTIKAGSENKVILETYIKSICRDEFGLIRIRGEDEMNKVTEAQKKEEDVLTYDKDKFDIKVSHLPPKTLKFVHSTAEAMFFHVIDPKDPKDNTARPSSSTSMSTLANNMLQHFSQYIIVVRSEDSTLNLFIPSMLRNALYDLWNKTLRRWLIQTLSMETYTNLINLLGGNQKNTQDTSKITLYALRSSAKRLRLFFQEAERFHRESKTNALYIRDMLYGQNFKAQPRPMSTIAVEPGSGLDRLKEDVRVFWTQRKKLEQNDLPFQRVHLLHGPPGNGKSSILQALAIQYEIPYFYLDANAVGTADMLRALLTRYTTSERCLVVIEDAESAMPKPEKYVDNGASKKRGSGTGNSGGGDGGGGDKNTAGNVDDDDEEDDESGGTISVKEFVELINGSQSPRPAGRLICLTTNTLDALPAEVLRLVNSQGNMFEFPNAGEETMKGYWNNFFQSEDYWNEFFMNYQMLWGQELYEEEEAEEETKGQTEEETEETKEKQHTDNTNNTPKQKRLHSAADLQKYCMRFRGRPQDACLYENIQSFTPSKNTYVGTPPATKQCQPTANVKEPFQQPLLMRQSSREFGKTHNIPQQEATEWLDNHNREWAMASKALQAQQIKVFETNRIAVVEPLLNNDIRLGMTTTMSTILMAFGYFWSGFLTPWIDQKKLSMILLLLPGCTATWSWYEQWEKRKSCYFVLEARASIGHALQKWFRRRIAHLTSEFEINTLRASHLRQGPLESNAKVFESVVAVTAKDGPQAFCITTKDKTASVLPRFIKEKWLGMSVSLNLPLNSEETCEEMEGIETKDTHETEKTDKTRLDLQFSVEGAKRIILHQETRAEKQLRRAYRGYKRQDMTTSRSLKVVVNRNNDTKACIQQLLQMALEEHAADTLDQAIKMLDTRVISGKLDAPHDEYFQQAEVFRSSGVTSEIKRLEDHSFHWPKDDPAFHSRLTNLMEDAILFDQSKEFYTLRGIPFRRSYLLSGSSASGKEYFVRFLAHKLGREICILDFSKISHRLISNAGLAMAVNALGSNAILVMRHLDSLVSASEGNAGRSSAGAPRLVRHGRHGARMKRVKKPLTYSGILVSNVVVLVVL